MCAKPASLIDIGRNAIFGGIGNLGMSPSAPNAMFGGIGALATNAMRDPRPDWRAVWVYHTGSWYVTQWRCPKSGRMISRDAHGERTDDGWEIGHIIAEAFGGRYELENLRPEQWEANRSESRSIADTASILRELGIEF